MSVTAAKGFVASGVDVMLTGPLPTPAIAYLTKKSGSDFGIVISASHNPYYDNGIKFFDSEGEKLSDEELENLAGQYENIRRANEARKNLRAA